jgi:hypothetical protein
MTNPIFLTAKRGPAIAFAVLSTGLLIVLPIVSGVYLAVGKSNPAPKIAHSLLAKSEFRDAAANKLIESIDPKEEYKGMINENKGDNYVSDNNNKFNNDITNMVDSINNLLNK